MSIREVRGSMPVKPSQQEEEYHARLEFERRKKVEEERLAKMVAEERDKLKQLHYMRCPKCGMELIAIDYRGVEVDKCSACEGIWLDAGELEQIAGLEKKSLDKWFSVFKR
jgi:hypothetical protein